MSNRGRASMHSAKRIASMTAAAVDIQRPARASNGLRPLSPYNFFFRVERNRILHEMSNQASGCAADPTLSSNKFYARALSNRSVFMEQLLQDQWSRDPSQKRKHRKVHGKISFASLTQLISANWQALPEPVKKMFRDISACDHRHHNQEADMDSANESSGCGQP
jgi:hypothetical protein